MSASDHIFAGPFRRTRRIVIISKRRLYAIPKGAISEVGDGWYAIALTWVDTNTIGDLSFHVTASGADPTDFTNQIILLVQRMPPCNALIWLAPAHS